MEKTVFTSGNYAFEAFSDEGVLYSAQRIQEYIPLKVTGLQANQTKTVLLNHPSIDFDLKFLQLQINKSNTTALTLTVDIYRGSDYLEQIVLTDANLPYQFPNGSILDPHGHEYNLNHPIELRFTPNRAVDDLFIICEKCYVYPILELLASY